MTMEDKKKHNMIKKLSLLGTKRTDWKTKQS